MCYAIPGVIQEIQGEEAIVDYGGVKKRVNISLLRNPRIGDHVLVHAGFAIEKMTPKEADRMLREMGYPGLDMAGNPGGDMHE